MLLGENWCLSLLEPKGLSNDDGGIENVAKNEFAFFQTKSRLFGPAPYVKCRRLFLELNS